MSERLETWLQDGQHALASADWRHARACFEQALPHDSSGRALSGLADALYVEGDYAGAIERSEQAFGQFRACGDDVRAAVCARSVAYLYWVVRGDGAAMGGWLARAVRLIEGAGDCPERARIELTQAIVASDPEVRERHLTAAAEIAERHGDFDMVFDVMSQRGLHLVAAGDVSAGMALLDESLAAVAGGEVRDLIAVGSMYCKMLHACELTADVRRAEEWLELADRFAERTNRVPISAICRTHYGGVLVAAGRWSDAERELCTAVELYDRSFRALRGAALARLAGLRVRQGRAEEAASLLTGAGHDAYSIGPLMELHLAGGEPELALVQAERWLHERPAAQVSAPLLMLVVSAQLAIGDTEAAAETAGQLSSLAASACSAVFTALAEYASGLVAAAEDSPSAVGHLESAVCAFDRLGLIWEGARARLDLAAALPPTQSALAVIEARGALERFQSLHADRDANAATALLRRLGVRGHTGPKGGGALTSREREVLELLGQGLSNQDIADRLVVSRRTAEHHVSNILAKLGLSNRSEATAYALRRIRVSGP